MMKGLKKRILTIISTFTLTSAYSFEQPNIIWLMAEDISTDLACYGMKAVKTPNLDKLANEGIRYTHCFCTNSICSPSRSAMMTGVHQLKINAQHHRSNRDVPLPEPYKPFTYWLREAGYTCILGNELVMGKGRKTDCNFKHQPVGEWDGKESFGLFDKYDVMTPEDQPFFAQIQLLATHRGDWWNEVREKSQHPVNPDSVELPPYFSDHPVIRLDWAKYLDQIEYIDNEIGLLIQDLKNKGMYENTVIIFIGDNGRCNVRGKGYLHDPGLHIPLIVNWPDGIKPKQVNNDVISTTDITATILGLAGAVVPDYLIGKSFLEEGFIRRSVFSARDLWDEVMDKSRSISTGQYKYIRNDMPEVPWDAHQAYLEFFRPAIHVMRKLMWEGKLKGPEKIFFTGNKPKEELYDLKSDPFELNNLVGNDDFKNILADMRKQTDAFEKQMAPVDTIFHPVFPGAVHILEWLKYTKPDEYLKILDGVEIGFDKISEIYDNTDINKNW